MAMRVLALLLLSVCCSFGQADGLCPFDIEPSPAAAGGGGGGALVSTEDCENVSGSDETWAGDTGAWFNFDYASTAGHGSQMLRCTNSGGFKYITNTTVSATTTNFFSFKMIIHASVSASIAITFSRLGVLDEISVKPRTDGYWSLINGGQDSGAIMAAPWVAGRTNRIVVEHVKGSGNNSIARLWFSDTSDTWAGTGSHTYEMTDGDSANTPNCKTIQMGNNDAFDFDWCRDWDSTPLNADF